ncbi:MAG: hypothetical protein QM674_18510 [Burkholderiaceae bacterium]
MITARMIVVGVIAGGLAQAAIGVETSPKASVKPSTASRTFEVPADRLSLPAPTRTIHWAINRDGSVELGDRPKAGPAVRQGVQTYAGTSSAEASARAQRERDYWRAQSDAFAARQRERDRELDARRDEALARVERQQHAMAPYFVVPSLYRGRPIHGVPGWSIPGAANLGSTPQAAALGGGPSPFLSSGFARTPGR